MEVKLTQAHALFQVYEFKVSMSCEGCSAAVNRVLGRLQGKTSLSVDPIISAS